MSKAKLNKNSDLYFVVKTFYFPLFGVSKVHIVDDDCNEFIALVRGFYYPHTYVAPDYMKIFEYMVYSDDLWNVLENGYEYEKAIKI